MQHFKIYYPRALACLSLKYRVFISTTRLSKERLGYEKTKLDTFSAKIKVKASKLAAGQVTSVLMCSIIIIASNKIFQWQ